MAMIVSRCDGLSGMADGLHDEALEQIIEERRQKALLSIEKMREPQ